MPAAAAAAAAAVVFRALTCVRMWAGPAHKGITVQARLSWCATGHWPIAAQGLTLHPMARLYIPIRLFTYLCVLPLQSASPGSAGEEVHPGVIGRIKEAVGSVFKGSHKVCMHTVPQGPEDRNLMLQLMYVV